MMYKTYPAFANFQFFVKAVYISANVISFHVYFKA